MLPWPVIYMILDYANYWPLRLICRRFANHIEKTYRYEYMDLRAILEHGKLSMLLAYFKQYNYNYYNIIPAKTDIKNIEIFKYVRSAFTSTDFKKVFCSKRMDIIKSYNECPESLYYHAFLAGHKEVTEFLLTLPAMYSALYRAVCGAFKNGNLENVKK